MPPLGTLPDALKSGIALPAGWKSPPSLLSPTSPLEDHIKTGGVSSFPLISMYLPCSVSCDFGILRLSLFV